jgi:hypothetical protein
MGSEGGYPAVVATADRTVFNGKTVLSYAPRPFGMRRTVAATRAARDADKLEKVGLP